MATITTGLALHDQMTGVVRGIANSLNLTISAMEDMQRSVDRSFDDRPINAARNAIQQAEMAIKDLVPPIDQAEKEQKRFNRSLKDGENSASDLLSKITGFIGAYVGFRAVSNLFSSGFDRLVGIDTGIAKLEALGHSGRAIDDIMDNAITSVTGTAFRMEEAVNTAASAVAAGIRPGQQLERYLSLTADAAAIAGVSMNEMGAIFNKVTTSGMIQAQELNQIADRGIPIFQMLADQMGVTAQAVRSLASEGKISSDIFLNAIESGFGGSAQTMGISSFQATLDNIGASISRISANFLNGTSDGTGFFDQIKPRMVELLNTLKSFEDTAAAIGERFGTLFNAFIENWSWLEPIVWGFGGALAALIPILVVLSAKQLIWNTIMKANPIFLVISLVAGLIVFLVRLWQTNDDFVAGFMRGWNAVLNFFGTFPAYFWQLVEWLLTPFQWWASTVGKIYDTVINGIIKGINTVLELINKITGSSYEIAAEFSFENIADKAIEFAGAKRDEAYANAALKAAEREQKVLDMLDSRAAKQAREGAAVQAEQFSASDIPGGNINIDRIGVVGEVGKIRDEVDISSEDLKMMRELAEMRSIHNFVTLTPQISVQTGDIRETADADEIIDRITVRLEEEISSSARGVYT